MELFIITIIFVTLLILGLRIKDMKPTIKQIKLGALTIIAIVILANALRYL